MKIDVIAKLLASCSQWSDWYFCLLCWQTMQPQSPDRLTCPWPIQAVVTLPSEISGSPFRQIRLAAPPPSGGHQCLQSSACLEIWFKLIYWKYAWFIWCFGKTPLPLNKTTGRWKWISGYIHLDDNPVQNWIEIIYLRKLIYKILLWVP